MMGFGWGRGARSVRRELSAVHLHRPGDCQLSMMRMTASAGTVMASARVSDAMHGENPGGASSFFWLQEKEHFRAVPGGGGMSLGDWRGGGGSGASWWMYSFRGWRSRG